MRKERWQQSWTTSSQTFCLDKSSPVSSALFCRVILCRLNLLVKIINWMYKYRTLIHRSWQVNGGKSNCFWQRGELYIFSYGIGPSVELTKDMIASCWDKSWTKSDAHQKRFISRLLRTKGNKIWIFSADYITGAASRVMWKCLEISRNDLD